MRFATFTSLALALAAAVSAVPTGQPKDVAARDTSLVSSDKHLNALTRDTLAAMDVRDTAKFKASKIDLDFPKKLEKGSIPQKEREDATDLAKHAMYEAEVSAGKVIYGWHDENTEDPVEHFTVKPSSGQGESNGKIHIHRDGSWTQGPGGKSAHGDGKKP